MKTSLFNLQGKCEVNDTLKISELIAQLMEFQARYGDLAVVSSEAAEAGEVWTTDAYVSDVFHLSPYGYFTRDPDDGEPMQVLVLL